MGWAAGSSREAARRLGACCAAGQQPPRGHPAGRLLHSALAGSVAVGSPSPVHHRRVHCLGQQQDVHVCRYSVEDSIEERMLAVQEQKRDLVKVSCAEGG